MISIYQAYIKQSKCVITAHIYYLISFPQDVSLSRIGRHLTHSFMHKEFLNGFVISSPPAFCYFLDKIRKLD